jgi:hypothetical protein
MGFDILGPTIRYERRVVVFYDVLGWRSKIAWAGTDPERLHDLQTTVGLFAGIAKKVVKSEGEPVRMTSFSDNVVLSQPLKPGVLVLLCYRLGLVLLTAAYGGFLIRGAITVGNIVHTEDFVFGPALNRAYELESEQAIVPRIIFDPDTVSVFGELPPMIVKSDDGLYFIDPFTRNFERFVQMIDEKKDRQDDESLNFDWLTPILARLKVDLLTVPMREKEWHKFSWLYDRLATELGVPPASSYPRIYPSDVVE